MNRSVLLAAERAGVDVAAVRAEIAKGRPLLQVLAWLYALPSRDARDPTAYFCSVVRQGLYPADSFTEHAKLFLEEPTPDLGVAALLPEVPREPSMNEKKNRAIQRLKEKL